MRDKVCVEVLLAATGRASHVRIPLDVRVADLARQLARMLSARAAGRYVPGRQVGLMVLSGRHAGMLLEGSDQVRAFVEKGVIRDGMSLALVG